MRKDMFNEIRKNKFKTFFLFIIFFIVVGFLALAVSYVFAGGYSFGILFFAGLFAIIFSLVSYYSGDKIVLSTSHAKPASKKKYRHLHNVVEGLAISAGIPKPKVYIINDPSPNAFATGRNPENASVAVTTGLINLMNREELEGVIAHELSHIQNQDIKIMTLVGVLFGLVAMISDIVIRTMFWSSISGRGGGRKNGSPILLIIAVLFVVLSPIIALIIQMSISRKREYLADSNAAALTRYPQGLANALKKIKSANKPVKYASKGTAHFYISNPLKKKKKSKLNLFSTHPPLHKRIQILESM